MALGRMWFGTEERMRWIPAPKPGWDVSMQNWNASGTLLNGGGYSFNSFGAHREFQMNWPEGEGSRTAAQIIQSYASGTFGKGLIYFIDPSARADNILPAHWADPSLALRGGVPLIRTYPAPITSAPTSNYLTNDLPVTSATYNLALAPTGFPGVADSLFIPIPPGAQLALGAIYSFTGSGGVFYAPVNTAGTAGTAVKLPATAQGSSNLAPTLTSGGSLGVRIWVGKSAVGPASVTLTALTVRLIGDGYGTSGGVYGGGPYGSGPYGGDHAPEGTGGPWSAGRGHSGCRFSGFPTYVNLGGDIRGGHVSYSATLKEVGAWMV